MDSPIRIEISENGPYLVYGDVPLTEMAPVHTFNGEPVEWHTLRQVPTPTPGPDAPLELCRCGKSSSKPFCDNSHEAGAFDGTETADRRPFAQRAEEDSHGDVTLLDDGPLCVSAGFCGTRTTSVWALLGESDDPQRAALMREMVWRCPSGRLVLRDSKGTDVEPDLDPEIAVIPGGPLWVRGGIQIISADGSRWEPRNRVTLCRCGESSIKPFCDGSHADAHFDER